MYGRVVVAASVLLVVGGGSRGFGETPVRVSTATIDTSRATNTTLSESETTPTARAGTDWSCDRGDGSSMVMSVLVVDDGQVHALQDPLPAFVSVLEWRFPGGYPAPPTSAAMPTTTFDPALEDGWVVARSDESIIVYEYRIGGDLAVGIALASAPNGYWSLSEELVCGHAAWVAGFDRTANSEAPGSREE